MRNSPCRRSVAPQMNSADVHLRSSLRVVLMPSNFRGNKSTQRSGHGEA